MLCEINSWVLKLFRVFTQLLLWPFKKTFGPKITKKEYAHKDENRRYITYEEFIKEEEKYKAQLHCRFPPSQSSVFCLFLVNMSSLIWRLLKRFTPRKIIANLFIEDVNTSLTTSNYSELHNFLVNMSSLTGLLLISSKTREGCCGTGFIVKLRRQLNSQCPCPADHTKMKTEHAIVTISTAYHVFNKKEEKVKRFAEVDEIWDEYKTEFKLDYNDSNTDIGDLKKTLYGHRLIEMDKDLDYDCDWCAIECVTHDMELIETLEKTISDYQRGLAELYKKSQTVMYKDVNLVVIIGHPRGLAKKISIGQSCHRELLKEVRSRQTWCRYSYDNMTSPGSSGSPIYKWGQPITGFGYWFGHPHNHSEGGGEGTNSEGKKVCIGKSTIGVENIY